MGQITIYIDDVLEARLRSAAENEKISKSRWVTKLIKERLRDEWPEEVRQLAGAWTDFPEAAELRDGLTLDVGECL
jgi:hypothetical protein